jgi:hypothetical protein
MSNPYILVNPQTTRQFAALVCFLKEVGCPFQVPEDQHFDTSHLCANHELLDGAIQDAFRAKLLRPEDIKIFGDEVEDYTTHKVVHGVQLYKIPKETKEFWGAEYLNKEGFITEESAQHRLTRYAIVHSLLLPFAIGFSTNEELRCVLKCDKTDIYFAELPELLLSMCE